eukprot:764962-Hanusia_phi.AAC.1
MPIHRPRQPPALRPRRLLPFLPYPHGLVSGGGHEGRAVGGPRERSDHVAVPGQRLHLLPDKRRALPPQNDAVVPRARRCCLHGGAESNDARRREHEYRPAVRADVFQQLARDGRPGLERSILGAAHDCLSSQREHRPVRPGLVPVQRSLAEPARLRLILPPQPGLWHVPHEISRDRAQRLHVRVGEVPARSFEQRQAPGPPCPLEVEVLPSPMPLELHRLAEDLRVVGHVERQLQQECEKVGGASVPAGPVLAQLSGDVQQLTARHAQLDLREPCNKLFPRLRSSILPQEQGQHPQLPRVRLPALGDARKGLEVQQQVSPHARIPSPSPPSSLLRYKLRERLSIDLALPQHHREREHGLGIAQAWQLPVGASSKQPPDLALAQPQRHARKQVKQPPYAEVVGPAIAEEEVGAAEELEEEAVLPSPWLHLRVARELARHLCEGVRLDRRRLERHASQQRVSLRVGEGPSWALPRQEPVERVSDSLGIEHVHLDELDGSSLQQRVEHRGVALDGCLPHG